MANIKFSQFTADGNIDGNSVTAKTGSETSFLVGYDSTGNTNNMWTFPQVAEGLPTIYAGDGTLSGARHVNLGTNNLGFTNGKVGVGLTAPLYTFETKATIAGNWVARIMNESATGYGLLVRADNASSNITFATHNGAGYTTAFHGTGEVGIGTATNVPSAKLHVKGSGTTSATTSFLVEDSAGADILTVTDDSVVKIKGQAYTELHTGTTPLDPNWNNGNVQESTLTSGSSDFDPTNPKAGATYILKLTQPGSGAAGTVNWDNIGAANIKWPGGTEPTLTATNGAVDIITLICTDGTGQGVYYANATLDMQ